MSSSRPRPEPSALERAPRPATPPRRSRPVLPVRLARTHAPLRPSWRERATGYRRRHLLLAVHRVVRVPHGVGGDGWRAHRDHRPRQREPPRSRGDPRRAARRERRAPRTRARLPRRHRLWARARPRESVGSRAADTSVAPSMPCGWAAAPSLPPRRWGAPPSRAPSDGSRSADARRSARRPTRPREEREAPWAPGWRASPRAMRAGTTSGCWIWLLSRRERISGDRKGRVVPVGEVQRRQLRRVSTPPSRPRVRPRCVFPSAARKVGGQLGRGRRRAVERAVRDDGQLDLDRRALRAGNPTVRARYVPCRERASDDQRACAHQPCVGRDGERPRGGDPATVARPLRHRAVTMPRNVPGASPAGADPRARLSR